MSRIISLSSEISVGSTVAEGTLSTEQSEFPLISNVMLIAYVSKSAYSAFFPSIESLTLTLFSYFIFTPLNSK